MSVSTFKRLATQNSKNLKELMKEAKSLTTTLSDANNHENITQLSKVAGTITQLEALIGKVEEGSTKYLNKMKLQLPDEDFRKVAEDIQDHMEQELLEETADAARDLIVELKMVLIEGDRKEKELFHKTTQQHMQSQQVTQTGNHQTRDKFRVPTFQIPVFEGDPTKFSHFWNAFEHSIHMNPHLSGISKLIYLHTYLQGEASLILTNLEITDDNYSKAVDLLKALYTTKTSLRKLMSQLLGIPQASQNIKSLRTTYMKVKSVLTMIEEKESIDNIAMLTTVENKFPYYRKAELRERERKQDTGEWNTTKWMKELLKTMQWQEHHGSTA